MYTPALHATTVDTTVLVPLTLLLIYPLILFIGTSSTSRNRSFNSGVFAIFLKTID